MRAKPDKRRFSRKVVLTERDFELLDALWRFGILTRSQLQTYFEWGCVSDINRRLRKLFDAGYLDRRFLPRRFGTTPAAYLLGSEGVAALANRKGVDATVLNRRRYRFRNLGDNLLPHELLISDFGCVLQQALRRSANSALIEWRNADDIAKKCNAGEEIADLALKPDAYAAYHLKKVAFNAFIEADLGTESLSRIRDKVDLYRSYKASGLFVTHFRRQGFRVLFITSSGARARNICHAIPVADGLKIFAGNIEGMRSDPIFAPVWMTPGELRAVPLHAIGGGPLGGTVPTAVGLMKAGRNDAGFADSRGTSECAVVAIRILRMRFFVVNVVVAI